jgi:hypothetical protein
VKKLINIKNATFSQYPYYNFWSDIAVNYRNFLLIGLAALLAAQCRSDKQYLDKTDKFTISFWDDITAFRHNFLLENLDKYDHIASKWNRCASCNFSRKSARLSLQCKKTINTMTRPQVPTKAKPVNVIPRLGVMKSLASHLFGLFGGFGITYI